MEILIDALLVIVALFFVVNYTKSKAMELVILLSCGVLAKAIFSTIEVNRLISEIALGLAMLGIGLGVSPKALADSGKTAILLIILQFAIGAGIFFWGGDWKPLGIALLFQSTPLVVEITNRSTNNVRAAMLGLMALQDVSSGILATMASSGGIEQVTMIITGYVVLGTTIYLLAGKGYTRFGGKTIMEAYYENKIDPTEHSMKFVFVIMLMLSVGVIGKIFGLGLPSSFFLLGFLLPTDSATAQSRHHFEEEIGKLSELGKGVFFLLLGAEITISISVETVVMAMATLAAIAAVSTIATLLIVRKDRTIVFRAFLASGEFGPILLSALGLANPGVVLGIIAAMLLSSIDFFKKT